MGQNYQAQKRVEHVAIACGPDMIKPTPNSPPAPFVTYAEFNIATGVADQASGNQYPLFTSLSSVPTCKGGPPGGKGIKSGTWNGEFKPTQWSPQVKVDGGWQVYHGHQGTINSGNASAKVTITVAPGASSSPCISALQVQFERLKVAANTQFNRGKWDFAKGMGEGAWDNVKGYGDTASSIWNSVSGGASALWNDPWGALESAGSALNSVYKSSKQAVADVIDLGKSIYNGDPSVDDMLDSMEDLVNELGPEAVCALAKMLEEINDNPNDIAKSIGSLGSELAIQIGMALASGGAGNAAAAAAKGTKLAKMGGKGIKFADDIGDKLRSMGVKDGDSLSETFRKLKKRRTQKRAPDRVPPPLDPHKSHANPQHGGNDRDNHNKGPAEGKGEKPCPLCPIAGKPVNPVQGCKVLSGEEDTDFNLPGIIPLEWQRSYASNSVEVGWWGQGWATAYSLRLEEHELGQVLVFIDSFGRHIRFPRVAPGREFFSRHEHITLTRTAQEQYRIVSGDGSMIVFGHRVGKRHYCTALMDANGNGHRLEYDARASLPSYLLANGGQVLALQFGKCGQHHGEAATRLQRIELVEGIDTPLRPQHQHPYNADDSVAERLRKLAKHASSTGQRLDRLLTRHTLVSYHYSADADLVEVRTSNGTPPALTAHRRFAWRNHLMVMHCLPAGLQAHYVYDRYDPSGRVQHHWQDIASGSASVQMHWFFEYTASHTTVSEHAGRGAEHAKGQYQRQTVYHFDKEQRWTGMTDAQGAHTRFELDAYGNVKAVHDADGGVTRYVLDGLGRPHQTINAAKETTTVLWHGSLEVPTQVINPLGASVSLAYDAHGNVVEQTDPLGHTTRYERNAQGLVTRIHDAKGGIKHLGYDAWGQLLTHTDCSGQTTRFSYDGNGQLTSVTNALQERTHYQHDARGNLLKVQHPSGEEERFTYDAEGRLIAHTDTAGQTTRWELAADGLPLRRVNALGHVLGYEYDAWRRLVCLRNENQAPYRFVYDALDRLTAQWSFDGLLSSFGYSAGGQLQQVREFGQIEADGANPDASQVARAEHLIETRFERDAVGRLLSKQVKARGQAALRTRFGYDAAGQLTRAVNAHCAVTLGYDAAGQLVREHLLAPGLAPASLWPRGNGLPGGRSHTLAHGYDALGNRTHTTLPDGRVLNTLHYGSGHVHQINLDGEVISDFERDALHRERSRTQGALQSLTSYDALGRVTAQRVQAFPGGSEPAAAPLVGGLGSGARIQRQYRYDRAGQLAQMSDWRTSVRYSYDPLGQLLAANAERFAFDPAHNLLPAHPADTPPSQGRLLNNRLTVFEDKRFEHDAHGRVVAKHIGHHTDIALHWDAEHQLASSVTTRREGRGEHSPERATTTVYAYDPFGRRLCKFQPDALGRPRAAGSHWFVWDGNRLLQDLQPQPQGRLRTDTYVYEPDSFVPLAQLQTLDTLPGGTPLPSPATTAPPQTDHLPHPTDALAIGHTHWREPGSGRILPLPTALGLDGRPVHSAADPANDDYASGGVRIRHYHCDQIGTPRELTDAAGQITWQATYKAWGNIETVQWEAVSASFDYVEDTADRSGAQPLRFQGQYFDVETGLHYNRFRYYDPDCGRFISHDPIGLDGGENTFGYVPNPSGWVDPLGLCNWGDLLKKNGIPQPEGMINPHGHHIIFKGDFLSRPKILKQLLRSRAIVAKYDIDPVNDVGALMWAQNTGHSAENAKAVADRLESADRALARKGVDPKSPCGKLAMYKALQKTGARVFN